MFLALRYMFPIMGHTKKVLDPGAPPTIISGLYPIALLQHATHAIVALQRMHQQHLFMWCEMIYERGNKNISK